MRGKKPGTITKTDFERVLNAQGVPDSERKSNGGRLMDKTQYGYWLRHNDLVQFNVLYNDYCRQTRDERAINKFYGKASGK
jgi:hypothetical protein